MYQESMKSSPTHIMRLSVKSWTNSKLVQKWFERTEKETTLEFMVVLGWSQDGAEGARAFLI